MNEQIQMKKTDIKVLEPFPMDIGVGAAAK
jgi:hypothetical protein